MPGPRDTGSKGHLPDPQGALSQVRETISMVSALTDVSMGHPGCPEEGPPTQTWGEGQLPEGGDEVEF